MFNPEIGFVGDTSNGSTLSEENAKLLATVRFICKNFFTREFYAFEKSSDFFGVVNLPAGQYHIQKLHSLVDKDVDFGVFAAARRPDCLLFQSRTGTLMHLTESRINLKQGRVFAIGINDFQQSLKQTKGAPKAELVVNTVPITVTGR